MVGARLTPSSLWPRVGLLSIEFYFFFSVYILFCVWEKDISSFKEGKLTKLTLCKLNKSQVCLLGPSKTSLPRCSALQQAVGEKPLHSLWTWDLGVWENFLNHFAPVSVEGKILETATESLSVEARA